jgi:hypothetical protein
MTDNFAGRLRQEFDRSDFTVTEAAAASGVHFNSFRNYLSGRTRPNKPQMDALCRVFPGLAVDDQAVAS